MYGAFVAVTAILTAYVSCYFSSNTVQKCQYLPTQPRGVGHAVGTGQRTRAQAAAAAAAAAAGGAAAAIAAPAVQQALFVDGDRGTDDDGVEPGAAHAVGAIAASNNTSDASSDDLQRRCKRRDLASHNVRDGFLFKQLHCHACHVCSTLLALWTACGVMCSLPRAHLRRLCIGSLPECDGSMAGVDHLGPNGLYRQGPSQAYGQVQLHVHHRRGK